MMKNKPEKSTLFGDDNTFFQKVKHALQLVLLLFLFVIIWISYTDPKMIERGKLGCNTIETPYVYVA